MKYQQPKGTFDIVPSTIKQDDNWRESDKWHHIEATIRKLAHDYGYREIRTPIFEMTGVFTSGVGETSDIVSKEMYTFDDKGGRSMTLRPEGTAAVARAFVENHLPQLGQNHKLFYIGPFFRYDRPQAGRYRQFHQFGVENIGSADPESDIEIIDMMCELYRRLGIKERTVLLNSVGSDACRDAYRTALKAFLKPYLQDLSEESKVRFEKNPLRILDTKNPKEKDLLTSAPSILDHLSAESKAHYEAVKSGLLKLGVECVHDPKLVRGLDYYTQTVFEVTSSVLGAQNSIGAGGRYDGLIKRFGGPNLPSTGFSIGLDRLISTMIGLNCTFPKPAAPFLAIIPIGEKARESAIAITYALRHSQIPSEIILNTNKLQKAMQTVDKLGAHYCVVLGDTEMESGTVEIKNMTKRESTKTSLKELEAHIKNLWKAT